MTAKETLAPEALSKEEVARFLAQELAPPPPEVQQVWLERMRARGVLCDLPPEDTRHDLEAALAAWSDFMSLARREEGLAATRQIAAREMRSARSVADALDPFLVLREVCREHLWARFGGDSELIAQILSQFERQAQHLMVYISESCIEARESLVQQRMHALIEAGMLLTVEHDLESVLQKIVDLARDIVRARYAALAVLDEAGTVTHFATSGLDEEIQARLKMLPTGRGILGLVMRGPLRLADVSSDPRAVGFPPYHPAMRTFLGVPIAAHGRVYGNLYLTEKLDGEMFTAEDELLATTFASQAAAAIENVRSIEGLRLLEEAQRRERQHVELLQRVIAAQEEERKRVARELHDNTGQSLTCLIIGLRTLESARSLKEVRASLADMRQHAAQALEELHHLAFELRPSALDDLGLVVALQRYVADFGRRTGIHIELQVDALEGARLDPPVEIALYRIVQEALTNVAKHAQANTASVLLQCRGGSLLLIVEDDGRGFEVPDISDSRGTHFGLMGMQERVNLLGGKLTIESTPGTGTTVYVEVPTQIQCRIAP